MSSVRLQLQHLVRRARRVRREVAGTWHAGSSLHKWTLYFVIGGVVAVYISVFVAEKAIEKTPMRLIIQSSSMSPR